MSKSPLYPDLNIIPSDIIEIWSSNFVEKNMPSPECRSGQEVNLPL